MFPRKEKITIISELSPQNEGDIDLLKTMILQSKMGGADAVKIQIYNSISLLGSNKKKFSEIGKEELFDLYSYSKNLNIPLFASAFDEERVSWLNELDINFNKIASKTHKGNKDLCKKIMSNGRKTFISNGLDPEDFSFGHLKNVVYFYCVPNYPTLLEDISLPDFKSHKYYSGFSDHSYGLTASKVAVVKGAKYIEKHFTISKSMQSSVNRAHYGSMDFNELVCLRSFCDDFVRMGG